MILDKAGTQLITQDFTKDTFSKILAGHMLSTDGGHNGTGKGDLGLSAYTDGPIILGSLGWLLDFMVFPTLNDGADSSIRCRYEAYLRNRGTCAT